MKSTNQISLLPYLSFDKVDFGVQDLYKPDSNRLRRNLSGIINFAKFREEKLVPYTDMQESVEHLLEDTADLEELNLKLVCICTYICTLVPHGCHTIAFTAAFAILYCNDELPSIVSKY